MTKFKTIILIAIVGLITGLVFYFFPRKAEEKIIKIGCQSRVTVLHTNLIQTMQRLKLLEKRGYKPEYIEFLSPSSLNEALASGEVDLVGGAGNLPVVAAMAAGIKAKIVAENVKSFMQAIIVDKEKEGEIKTLQDLIGKKVGVALGSGGHYYLVKTLADNGIDIKDINIVNIKGQDLPAALAANQVDACATWTPWPTKIEKMGLGKIIARTTATKETGFSHYAYVREDFINKNPDAVQAVVDAMQEAVEYMQKNYEQTCKWVSEWSGEDYDIILESSRNDKILEPGENIMPRADMIQHLTDVAEFALSQGLIANVPDFSQKVDLRFVNKTLGIR